MSAALASRIAEEFAAVCEQQAPGAFDPELRQRAMRTLTEQGLPTARDENWKYVNLRPLEKVRFAPPGAQPSSPLTLDELPAPIARYARYTFVDGVFAPKLSAPTTHTGVRVESMQLGASASGTTKSSLADAALARDLRFALLNEAFATDGASITVAAGTDCPSCVELLFVATTDGKSGASYPRVDFKVESGARMGLIERHVSIRNDANFINSAVNVEIARDAIVQHYRVQHTGARAIWFDTLTAALAQNARYQIHAVNLGALSARSTVRVQMLGQQSEVGVFNVSVGGKNQVHDTFALVEHVAPNARTEQSFRGISSGRARVAFNGKIVVHKNAQGTDSRQSLRGLLAGTDAEIDVRPQLEIYTDDVRCSHGATAGKLDDNMLFYLLSRGLDRETAQRLLKWAFLEDVVAKIEVPELRRQIEQSLAGQLNEAAALKELL
jgi:Fe-S cluster assembly protein SufD